MFGAFARFAARIDPDDPRGTYLFTCLLLASAGGFADAASYVLAGSFTGHLTGNTLLSVIGIVELDWTQVRNCSVAAVCFVCGTATGIAWPHNEAKARLDKLLLPILAEVAVIGLGLGVSMAVGLADPVVVLACLCLALGLQNGTLNKFGSVTVHSTYITGMSTSLLTALVKNKPDPKSSVLPLVISTFVGGAFFGAFFAHDVGLVGFAFILVPLVPAALIAGFGRPAGGQ